MHSMHPFFWLAVILVSAGSALAVTYPLSKKWRRLNACAKCFAGPSGVILMKSDIYRLDCPVRDVLRIT